MNIKINENATTSLFKLQLPYFQLFRLEQISFWAYKLLIGFFIFILVVFVVIWTVQIDITK